MEEHVKLRAFPFSLKDDAKVGYLIYLQGPFKLGKWSNNFWRSGKVLQPQILAKKKSNDYTQRKYE